MLPPLNIPAAELAMHSRHLALATCVFLASTAWGNPPSLSDAVRDAVAARKVDDSDHLVHPTFRDVANDGAILVGLEVGLAKWFDSEIPYAVRPVFRRGNREWTGGAAGSFRSKEIVRTIRVTAKPGYAVGGLWLRTGGGMDRLCLAFVRMTDEGLDPADTYTSPWVGSSDGGSDHYIDGKGQPIVGLLADAHREQARNLGLVSVRIPPVARKPVPKPEPGPTTVVTDPPVGSIVNIAEAPAASKSKLEQEAPATPDDDDGSLPLILPALCGAIGIPAGIIGIMAMGKERLPPSPLDDPRRRRPTDPVADRPKPEEAAGRTTVERPELARRLSPYLPATVAPAATGIDASTGEAPPYFLVRATYRARRERLTRIYVLPGELLVIDAGPGSDMNQVAGVAAAAIVGGGLIGSFIGGAVGGMVADAQKAKGEALQQGLNRLDLAGLLEWTTEEGNLRARAADLVGVSIDPASASFWREKSRAVGTFRFRDVRRGEFTFEFLSGAEVRGAIELLRRVLGQSLHVGHGWDDATAVYLNGV